MDAPQLLQLLQATLDANPNTRLQAELHLAQASRSSETALGLARLATDQQVEVPWRQAASFALKKYVKEYWSPFFASFKGPEATSPEVKEQVRQILYGGLTDPVRKIRLACANIVSLVAQPDWPEDWPTLLDQLLALVRSPSIDAVEGGMRALNDFVSITLTEDQLLPVAQDMLPTLLAILGAPETYGPSTRARVVLIFRQCVMTLFTVKDEHPAAVKAAVGQILPVWLSAFKQLLSSDPAAEMQAAGSCECFAVRTAVIQALEVVLNSFLSTLKATLPDYLAIASAHLEALLPVYEAACLSSSSDFSLPSASTGEEDSDVSTDLGTLVASIIDFVAQAGRRKAVRAALTDGRGPSASLVEFCLKAIDFAKMTTDDEDSWASDPNAFVADEDDEMMTAYNVRSAALDLAIAFVETLGDSAYRALQAAFERAAQRAEQQKAAGDEDWWKGYDSALAVVGAVAEDLIEHVQECQEEAKSPAFALEPVFQGVVMTYLTANDVPFLQGRAFVFASQFSELLPTQLAKQYLDAAISVLDSADASVPVKVSAVRALTNFFRHLKENVDPSQAATALAKLLPLLPETSENTLVLVLDAIQSLLRVGGPSIDAATCSALIRIVLQTWFEKPEDPLLGSSISDIFAALSACASPVVESALLNEALPALVSTMAEGRSDPSSIRAAAALDICSRIFSRFPTPLPPRSFERVAAVLFDLLATTEDRDVTQTGLDVVTTVIRKDVSQLLEWRSPSGESGLDLVLAVVARLLEPSESESGGLFVGDLVIHLVRKAGAAIGPVLPGLLQAFVARLATAETAMFSQSLILPFAYLLHQQPDTVLSLLENLTVPGPTGQPPQSALAMLLSHWCDYANDFQGYWNQKVFSVAMAQLYSLAAERPALQQVQVKGDLLLTDANTNKIMTRARARANPDQFPPIPFPAKALKLLLHDAQTAAQTSGGEKGVPDDAVSDDEDDEWADEGAEFTAGNEKDLDFLSDMLAGGGLSKYMTSDDDEDDDADEQDLHDDPIWQLDLHEHLKSFFRHAYETDQTLFRQLAESYLNEEEKGVLTHLLQSA